VLCVVITVCVMVIGSFRSPSALIVEELESEAKVKLQRREHSRGTRRDQPLEDDGHPSIWHFIYD